ncbi:MAG: glycosyltransferase family protein [Saprospiraceae bacterium]|nr:glycosyltransferase family protein [Saprospiraceae bacterium]
MSVVAIIQARMGSSRLPGKVLKPILGQALIARIHERVSAASLVDHTMIAATIDSRDEELEMWCASQEISIYRGPVDDIIGRFYEASQLFNTSAVIRLWGDCPFLDPAIIDQAVNIFIEQKLDYLNTFAPQRTFPAGLDFEIYHIDTLRFYYEQIKDPYYREFPFEYFRKNPERFKIFNLTYPKNLSHINLTVDYQEDFELASRIYGFYYPKNHLFNLQQVLDYLDLNPEAILSAESKQRNIEFKQKQKEWEGLL